MMDQSAYCLVSIAPIRSEKKDASEQVSQLVFGEPVSVKSIESPWCKISTYFDNYEGYVDEKQLRFLSKKELNRWLDGLHYSPFLNSSIHTPWGEQLIHAGSFVPFGYPDQFSIGQDQFTWDQKGIHKPFNSPQELGLQFLNTPYLWGGKTGCGIDCSGLIQLIFRLFDCNLPRDAYQQADFGSNIEFEDRMAGDVAFFANNSGKITHVGILNSEETILHASGRVRLDQFTVEGIFNNELKSITHQLSFIKRML